MLIGGWFAVRGKVMAMAQARVGYTGEYPVVPGIVPPVPFPEHHRPEDGDRPE
jgi:L-asparagine permease